MSTSATPVSSPRNRLRLGSVLLVSALLAACASKPGQAPVEDRPVPGRPAPTTAGSGASPAAEPASATPSPGAENAGKPGYYTVKPGDALIRIGLDVGQNWRDIARWNNLENPDRIEVGQVLRVIPPGADPAVAVRPVTAPGRAESRPLDPARPGDAAGGAGVVAGASAPVTTPPATVTGTAPAIVPGTPPAAAPAAPPAATGTDEDIVWAWPASGPVGAPFEEGRTKGLSISGRAGDPVLAAADGRVVYAGSGLRGYGNLVIIKHNNTFLTAYAHNQTLLVREDQAVRRGQRIAEMGATESDRVQLHFEVRRQGRPIDPARVLPAR